MDLGQNVDERIEIQVKQTYNIDKCILNIYLGVKFYYLLMNCMKYGSILCKHYLQITINERGERKHNKQKKGSIESNTEFRTKMQYSNIESDPKTIFQNAKNQLELKRSQWIKKFQKMIKIYTCESSVTNLQNCPKNLY